MKHYIAMLPIGPALLLSASCPVSAYERTTHQAMSRAAVDASNVVLDSGVLQDLGISAGQGFQIGSESGRSMADLIGAGSRDEDDIPRPLNHFYNPLDNSPLTIPIPLFNFTSPDWALEDRGQITSVIYDTQNFSYANARRYELDALTSPAESDRNRSFAMTFLTLGHVIHHIQDMAELCRALRNKRGAA